MVECSHLFPCSHPLPGEYVEVLGELRSVESRLQPFLQRYEEILGTAGTADYNNNVRGVALCHVAREEQPKYAWQTSMLVDVQNSVAGILPRGTWSSQ